MEAQPALRKGGLPIGKDTALLAEHKAADAVAMAMLGSFSPTKVGSVAAALVKHLSLNKEKCKALILDTTYSTRQGVLSGFKGLIKSSLTEDPYMCKSVAALIERSVDLFWAEVEDELERDLEAMVLSQLANENVKGPSLGGRWLKWYWRARAFVLSHYFPCDKSIFGKLRDPVYVFILCLSLAPISGIRFLIWSIFLLFFWTPGPPDEFMLLNFIMAFRGFQFFSTGILKTAWATTVSFYCLSATEVHDVRGCAHDHGPVNYTWVALCADYMGNVLLTTLAWCSLRFSADYSQNRFVVDGGSLDPTRPEAFTDPAVPWTPSVRRTTSSRKGGLFNALMCYDLCCFSASFLLLVALTLSNCEHADSFLRLMVDPQFKMNVFWVNVVFSVTTLPFVPMNISWIFSVFTRTTPTGFNRHGACVPFRLDLLDLRRRSALPRAWQTMKAIKDFGRARRREMAGVPEREAAAEPGYTDFVIDFSYGLWRAMLFAEMDTKDEAEIPEDLVSTPDQLMMVWDRF